MERIRGQRNAGSVFQNSKGQWVTKIIVSGKATVKYSKSKDAAEQLRLQLLGTNPDRAEPVAQPKDCFSGFLANWLETAILKPKTAEYYRNMGKYISPTLGDKRLSEITPLDIAYTLSETKKRGLSEVTVQHVYIVIHRVLQVATEWELIPSNPAAKLKKPKATPKEKQFWTVAQTQQFMTGQGHSMWQQLFTVALHTGLRTGELRGLQWEDIDLSRKLLKVQRNVVTLDNSQYNVQTPKTKSSFRTISLSQAAIDALEAWEPDTAKRSGYIFLHPKKKTFFNESAVRMGFLLACKRAAVPFIALHGLRHQHISLLAHAGVSVKAAQVRAGHSTAQMTLNIYTHVLGNDSDTTQALDNLLAKKSS
jgi:integrase